ncbi:MAG TPA: general stress protein CsbD [Cyclobacteriaceae bacterium]|nr:general stress protein CsbD [Cyclobacteriaceae bacterium]
MDATQKSVTEPFKITGDWNVQSKILKQKFSQLTDADLKFEPGKEDDLLKRVETRLNKKRDEVVNIIRKGQPAKT